MLVERGDARGEGRCSWRGEMLVERGDARGDRNVCAAMRVERKMLSGDALNVMD
jgi:hypothetical protein